METTHYTTNEIRDIIFSRSLGTNANQRSFYPGKGLNSRKPVFDPYSAGSKSSDFFEQGALDHMKSGLIPDLAEFCSDLYRTSLWSQNQTAMNFLPVFDTIHAIDRKSLDLFMQNPVTNHVLIRNRFIKVVLIHWKPGVESSLHGHPGGGCVFKVLYGQLREKRYVPATEKLMEVNTFRQGQSAYIDDRMAYHIVGNPYQSPAVSLHAYLRPGS